MRLLMFLGIGVAVLAGCSGSAQTVTSAAAQADPVEEAVDRALVDCFDPLHDSDGSGGFFEFCDRANAARTAGRLDCFSPSYAITNQTTCDGWQMAAGDIPPYYFFDAPAVDNSGPTPAPPRPEEAPPASEEPPVDQAVPDGHEPLPGEAPPASEEPPAEQAPVGPIDGDTGFPAEMKILEWNQIGGCQQLGDYCAQHSVYGDGRVQATRASGEVLSEGLVPVDLVIAVIENADVDIAAVVASLGPGPCRMAVDGIDHEVWIGPADLRINSCEFDLSGGDPLISAARQLGEAAEAAAPVVWSSDS